MKKLLTLIISLMTLAISAYCQETTNTTATHIGQELVVTCEGEQCDIIFQNRAIDSVFFPYSAQAKDVLTSLDIFGLPNIYIYKDYQGDGCPEAYHLLEIINGDKTTFNLISYFGNCSSLSKIHIKKDGEVIEFQFNGDKLAERPKTTYTYSLGATEMKKN